MHCIHHSARLIVLGSGWAGLHDAYPSIANWQGCHARGLWGPVRPDPAGPANCEGNPMIAQYSYSVFPSLGIARSTNHYPQDEYITLPYT